MEQRLDAAVVELHPLGQRRRDARDVVLDLVEELLVVDHDAAVLLVELLADHPDRHVGLPVEQRGGLDLGGQLLDLLPLREQAADVARDLLGGDALGRGAHDQAVLRGLHLVEDRAEPLALVVGQALGDAVGAGVRDQHHEPARQRDLLGEAGALVGDGVLGDLADDALPGLEDLLDAGVAALLDVVGVVLHVAPVEHGVLGGADVDERRLHAGQHVLDLAQVDVAVDLGDVVGRPRHVVLDEVAALEHGDLGRLGADADGHQVAADGAALALPAPALLEGLLVELGAVVTEHRLDRSGGLSTASLVAATALVALAARLTAATAAAAAPRPRPPRGAGNRCAGPERASPSAD